MYEGEVSRLLLFILTGLPRLAYQLTHATTTTTNDTTTNTTVVNNVTLPSYNNVWAGMFGNNPFDHPAYSITSTEVSPAYSVTASDIDRALAGEDGVDPQSYCDPINWWNYPGAPPEMVEMAHQEAKRQRDELIFKWDEGRRDGLEDVTDMETAESSLLDVPDVGFGETAFPEL